MTLPEARAVIADPTPHADATIRNAAHIMMQTGDQTDIQRARKLLFFGLPPADPTHPDRRQT